MAIHLFLFAFAFYKRIEFLKMQIQVYEMLHWYYFKSYRFMSIRLKSWFLLPNLLHLQKFKRKTSWIFASTNRYCIGSTFLVWYISFSDKMSGDNFDGLTTKKTIFKRFFVLFDLSFHDLLFRRHVIFIFSWCLHIIMS